MIPSPLLSQAHMEALAQLTRTHIVHFWGRRYRITPRLITQKLGDGQQLISLTPLATRPNYYLLFIDSRWLLDGEENEDTIYDHLEEIYDAIEDQYGMAEETYDHDNGRTYTKHRWFPALDLSYGVAWGKIDDEECKP